MAQSVEATAPCWRSPSPRRWQRSVGNAKLRSPAAWPGGRPEEPKSGLDAALADLIDDHRSGRQLVCVFSLQQAMKVFWLSCRPCRADLVFILGLIAASILSGPLSTCRDVKANPGRRTTVRHLPIGMAEVLSRDLLRLLVLALQVGYLACRDLACSGSDTLCPGGASELHGEGSAGWAGWCGWCSKCARSFRLAPNLFANSLAPWRPMGLPVFLFDVLKNCSPGRGGQSDQSSMGGHPSSGGLQEFRCRRLVDEAYTRTITEQAQIS